ncbi:peptide deformylase [Labrys okinawensis]|uniref:Peptide deformylase-like n=1 Tax=Labrys okinawensis TaxID=346911 RepID=A0A2S9Q6S4_9HYPH|nr:peptide deformylase [Labrys okinawensis]PRH85039.1 peptide deformylase [Labrys okinawensis]
MPVQPILRFPDPRLRLPAAPVTAFDTHLAALVRDLLDTMRAASGIGITAPHLGIAKRLTVLELPGENRVRVYVNPRILWSSEESQQHTEGSVSMPGVTETIERPARVRVAFQTLNGAEETEEADGLLAICLQHEIDQLDGIFWIQRLSRLKRERLIKRFQKQS